MNRLAQAARRGRVASKERNQVKTILEERNLTAAEEALQEILSDRGICGIK